jgi:hypothetical protein
LEERSCCCKVAGVLCAAAAGVAVCCLGLLSDVLSRSRHW